MTPFVRGVILAFKSSKTGSNCCNGSVFTNTGLAPVTETKSGNDTQYGENIIT